MTTAPLPSCSRTMDGSSSPILLLIWRKSSVPDGLIVENSSKAVRIQYFKECSGIDRRPPAVGTTPGSSRRNKSGAPPDWGRPARTRPKEAPSQAFPRGVSDGVARADIGPRPHMKSRSLLAHALAVNLLRVAGTVLEIGRASRRG